VVAAGHWVEILALPEVLEAAVQGIKRMARRVLRAPQILVAAAVDLDGKTSMALPVARAL
jgi:hypothetical protein